MCHIGAGILSVTAARLNSEIAEGSRQRYYYTYLIGTEISISKIHISEIMQTGIIVEVHYLKEIMKHEAREQLRVQIATCDLDLRVLARDRHIFSKKSQTEWSENNEAANDGCLLLAASI